jgi:hypothetical protein
MMETRVGTSTAIKLRLDDIGSEIYDGVFGTKQVLGKGSALEKLRSTNVFVADIESDCTGLQRLITAYRSSQNDYLFGFKLADRKYPVPVDFGWFTEWAMLDQADIGPTSILEFAERFSLVDISPDIAVKGFIEGLESFLGMRIDASEGNVPPGAGGSSSPRQMLDFRVHTRKKGGRVHYTRAYYLNYRSVFGSPTTPAHGLLDPGIYGFLVEYPGGQPFLDPGIYDVPPLTEAHLNY